MGKSDFIDTVLNFDIDKVEKSVQEDVIKNYLENPDWDIEKIYNSSKAAGPLSEWLESQIKYKNILLMVTPLRNTINELNEESKQLEEKLEELAQTIKELEKNIVEY